MNFLWRFIAWFTQTPAAPKQPVQPVTPPESTLPPPNPVPPPQGLLWATPRQAWHSVRVLCDELGLGYQEKNLICACIFQESRFSNKAVGKNPGSTDWGIVQVNDYYNIGAGKAFSSVGYVLIHPETCVRWMISMYRAGKLNLWSSYKTGAYKQWLRPNSPMWALSLVGGDNNLDTVGGGATMLGMQIPSWVEGALRGAGTVILIALLTYFSDATNLAFISNPFVIGLITSAALAWEQSLKDKGHGGLFGAVASK